MDYGAPRMTDFSSLLSDVRRRLDERLPRWLAPRVAAANAVSPEAGAVAEALTKLTLRGGKRMRAALVAVGYVAGSTDAIADWTVCEPAMIAFELLQTYLLVHDDWMDHDDVRRGGPAVHAILRETLGPALEDAATVLAGDLAAGYAQEALFETKVPAERLLAAARAYARVQVDVVHGQLAEMQADRATLGKDCPPASVETVHALKTASYTTTGPLLLGAALAGATPARTRELERFGLSLGIAFQLRDDVLGVFGDPKTTGKPVWNDIREGKRTALVEELAKEPSAALLLAGVLGNANATHDELVAVVSAMESTGARARVEERVRGLCAEAERTLQGMAPTLSPTSHAWLSGAISALGERTA